MDLTEAEKLQSAKLLQKLKDLRALAYTAELGGQSFEHFRNQFDILSQALTRANINAPAWDSIIKIPVTTGPTESQVGNPAADLMARVRGNPINSPVQRSTPQTTQGIPQDPGPIVSSPPSTQWPLQPGVVPQSNNPNPFQKPSIQDFEAAIRGTLPLTLAEISPDIKIKRMDNFLRVSIRGTPTGREERERLTLDLAPGYNTPLGFSIEMLADSGRKGLFRPEALLKSLTGQGNTQIHSPIEAFSQYIKTAFSREATETMPFESVQSRFSTAYTLGQKAFPSAQVVGGMEWVGPEHTPTRQARVAGRIAIGIASDVRDQAGAMIALRNRALLGRLKVQEAQAQGSPIPLEERKWTKLIGYYPVKDERGRLLLASTGTEPDEEMFISAPGKSVADIIKRQKIGAGIREQANMLRINPITGTAVVAAPAPLPTTERGFHERAGYRMIGGSLPGSTERAIGYVQPQTAFMAEALLSGSMIQYEDPLRKQGLIAGGFPVNREISIPQVSMYQLAEAEWEFGRFREIKQEGEPSTFERVSEEPLAALEPNESAIVGLMRYKTEAGEARTEPLRMSSPGRPTFFTGVPQLYIPGEIDEASGRGVLGAEEGQENIFLPQISEKFPGEVLLGRGQGPKLLMPADIEVGVSGKGIQKVTMSHALRPLGKEINVQATIPTVEGQISRRVYGVTGGPKLPEDYFAGHFLSMTPAQREQMLGEFTRVDPRMSKLMQRYARMQHSRTVTEMYRGQPVVTHAPISSEVLGQAYAKFMGRPYEWQTSAQQMYAHLRQIVEKLPVQQQVERYEYAGNLPSTAYYQSIVDFGQKRNIERRLFSGVQQEMLSRNIDLGRAAGRRALRQLYPGGYRKLKQDILQFSPTDLEGENKSQMYTFSLKGPAQYGTFFAPLVPEFLAKLAHIGYEEKAALTATYPDEASFLGLNLEEAGGASKTGFVPEHARAWRSIGEVARHQASETRLPLRYHEVTPELAAQIMAVDTDDLEEMSKKIEKGPGPFWNPYTNLLLPRPEDIAAVSAYGFEEDEEVQSALGHLGRQYPRALKALAAGETPETSGALRSVYESFANVFRSNQRSVAKLIQSSFIEQATSGRYAGWIGPLGTGYTPEQQMETQLTAIAKKAGMSRNAPIINETGEELPFIQLAKQQIAQAGGVPTIINRSPTVMRQGGVTALNMVTNEVLRSMGLFQPASTVVRGNNIISGSPLTTGYIGFLGPEMIGSIGDWDADLAEDIKLFEADPNMGLVTFSSQRVKQILNASPSAQIKMREAELQGMEPGTSLTPGGRRDVMAESLRGIAVSAMTGVTGREAGAPGTPSKFLSNVPWSDLFEEGVLQLEAGPKSSGRAYTAREMTEATASAMGWSPKEITKAVTGQSAFYQPYLDIETQQYKKRGGPHAIENLFSSAFFGATALGEYKLVGKPRTKSAFTTLWFGGSGKGMSRTKLFSQDLGRALTETVVQDISEMDTPNYQVASFWMSEKEEDVPILQAQMEAYAAAGKTPSQAIRRTLWGTEDTTISPTKSGYLFKADVTKTPLGMAFLMAAEGKHIGTLGRKPRKITVEGEELSVLRRTATQPIPFQGGIIPLGQLHKQPVMATAWHLQALKRRQLGHTDDWERQVDAPYSVESSAALYQQQQALIEAGKTPAHLLSFAVGAEGSAEHAFEVEQNLPVTSKRLSLSKLASLIPNQLTVSSTRLPMFGLTEQQMGLSAELIQQDKIEWFAQNVMGIDPSTVRTPNQQSDFELYTGLGTEAEATHAQELAERHGMFLYEQRRGERVPVVGPIMGIPYESHARIPARELFSSEMLAKYPELGDITQTELFAKYAPDIAGASFVQGPQGMEPGPFRQISMKWAKTAEAARSKATSPRYIMQEAQYHAAATARATAPRRAAFRELFEPMIRESTWFKKYWAGESEAEQERVITQNIEAHKGAIRQSGIETFMHGYTGESGNITEATPPPGMMLPAGSDVWEEPMAKGFLEARKMGATVHGIQQALPLLQARVSAAGKPGVDLGLRLANLPGMSTEPIEFRPERGGVNVPPTERDKAEAGITTPPTAGGARGGGTTQGPPPTTTRPAGPPLQPGSSIPPVPPEDDYIPIWKFGRGGARTLSGGIGLTSAGGIPIFGEGFSRGGPGGGTEQAAQNMLKVVFAGAGQTPTKGLSDVGTAMFDIEKLLSQPEVMSFEERAQRALAPIAGMPVEEALKSDLPRLALVSSIKNPEAYHRWYTSQRETVAQLTKSQQAVERGYNAFIKGKFDLPPEIGEVLTGAYTGTQIVGGKSEEIKVLSSALAAGKRLSETATDLGISGGKDVRIPLEALKKFDEALQKTVPRMEELAKVVGDTTENTKTREKALAELQKLEITGYKIPEKRLQLAEARKVVEAARAGDMEGITTERYLKAQRETVQLPREIAGLQAEATDIGEKDKDKTQLGMLARRMLGGFGLMYMRSVLGIAMGPSKFGYDEALQQQQQIETGMGAAYGGMMPRVNPEMEYQRAAAAYGGLGYSYLRQQQTKMLQEHPGLQGLFGMGQTAIGAGALGLTMNLWGAGIPGGVIAGLAGAAAVGSFGLQVAGAATEPESNAVRMAALRARYEPGKEYGLGGYAKFLENVAFNPTVWGYGLDKATQAPMVDMLTKMRQYAISSSGGDMREFLKQQGITGQDVGYWMGMYQQGQVAEYPSIPVEGILKAQILQSKYQIPVTQGAEGTFAFLAAGLSQGVPYEEAARAAVRTPGRGWEEQKLLAGYQISSWLKQGGLPTEEAEAIITGDERYQRLGMLAPQLGWQYVPGAPVMQPDQILAPGVHAFTREPDTEIDLTIEYKKRLRGLSDLQADLLTQRFKTQEARAMMGLPTITPDIAEVEGLTPAMITPLLRKQQAINIQTAMQQQVYTGYQQMGITTPDMMPMQGWTMGQYRQLAGQQEFGMGFEETMLRGGMAPGMAQTMAREFANLPPTEVSLYQGMAKLDRMSWASWLMQNPQTARGLPSMVPGLSSQAVSTQYLGMADVGPTGQLTGMGWGTTSLAMPMEVSRLMGTGVSPAAATSMSSINMAGRIWGGNWQNRTDVSQGLIGAMISGGQFGAQAWQQQESARYAAQSAGNQLAMLELQGRYTPMFWNIEDRQRALAEQQAQWGFGMQERQMGLQRGQFFENIGMNQMQALTQRQWTQEDWGYQAQQREMQWGWRQEDFQEQVRFMTGRERKLAERQMERETITFGMEGDRIETQQKRQQELWSMEDQRFALQKKQFEETAALQQESFEKQKEFHAQTLVLQQEQIDLSREYWKEQHALQLAAAGAAAGYAETQSKIAATMLEFSQFSETAAAEGNLFNDKTLATLFETLAKINPVFGTFSDTLLKYFIMLNGGTSTGTDSASGSLIGGDDINETSDVPGNNRTAPVLEAGGGPLSLSGITVVGERGIELLESSIPGSVYPNSEYKAMLYGQESNFNSYWNNSYINMSSPTSGGRESPGVINIFLGNERLASFVLNTVKNDLEVS
jgi:hypothetical protein